MSSPLRIAILWHQHQPFYKSGNEYLLPWTRLHGTKDYWEMASALERFPQVKATINVVPSLLLQLQDYAQNGAQDKVLRLSRIRAEALSDQEKEFILREFFLCNVDRMVLPYERYAELYRLAEANRIELLAHQEWLDLQTWYALTWIGEYARERQPFARLLAKGKNFTELEKQELLDASILILGDVIPTYRRLAETGQVELSVTPFYHPILPILCNSFAALEAMPNAQLPEAHIAWPEDAKEQIERGIAFFTSAFGSKPNGMWPSEGSVSTQAVELIRGCGITWTASDEEIIHRTLGKDERPLPHCFPWRVKTPAGPINMMFRDREMSDAIGFVYALLDPEKGAADFIAKALERRERIIAEYGEKGLKDALLPVILDGENCWEYYEENGRPFLEALYKQLSETKELRTVTISEGLNEIPARPERTLGRIAAGSWIGGNFKIWIGHEEDNTAWDLIAQARRALLEARGTIADDRLRDAYEHLLIAEGSDWFWWYGDENSAANEDDFDRLFREHLKDIYRLIDRPVPEVLNTPIHAAEYEPKVFPPSGPIAPALTGLHAHPSHGLQWEHAGHFAVKTRGGAMHRGEIGEGKLLYGTDGTRLYVRYHHPTPLDAEHGVTILLKGEHTVALSTTGETVTVDAGGGHIREGFAVLCNETLDAAIPLTMLSDSTLNHIGISVRILSGETEIVQIPQKGEMRIEL